MKVANAIRQALKNASSNGVIIMTPAHDARVDVLYVNALIPTLQTFGAAHMFLSCDSNVAHARNTCLNIFSELKQFQQLVMIDADMAWSLEDFGYLMEGPQSLVVAEYARKSQDNQPPVRGGAGFCRIHRSVLEQLDALMNEDGGERLPRYRENGKTMVDYCYTGAVGDGRYLSEDRGLWTYCALAGVEPRWETRTRLLHIGRAIYPYLPIADSLSKSTES
jgi:hypothetical protein